MSEKRLVNICNGLYGRVWLNGTSLFQAKSFSLELPHDILPEEAPNCLNIV